ncbi:hypothetical protein OAP51_07220 [Alphaproteobacteria bacterium]|nr:hypothetical protein [Alphaproteobacteria bacterium]
MDKMAALGIFGFLLFLAVGITQAVIGYMGIEYYFGTIAAVIALVAAFFLRLMLPLTIGTFFGAMEVLGWPWYFALLITAPGLLFAAPAMVAATLESISPKKNKDSF